MKKRISWGVAIALMAVTATLTMSLTYQYTINRTKAQVDDLSERMKMFSKLSEIDQKVRKNYLNELDQTALNNAIAQGYMNGIDDKHSYYLTQAEYTARQLELSGQMVGIGVDVTLQQDGTIAVTRVTPNSPAAAAGIQKGDILQRVGDQELTANDYSRLSDLIGGESGTEVELTVLRGEESIPLTATRKQFDMVTVDYRLMENGIGYLRITEFTDGAENENGTAAQFRTAVSSLTAQGATGLVIDVRNNPGGSLSAVSSVLDQILPAGNIVSSAGKDGARQVLYTSDSNQLSLPLAVLVNQNSASAAELLACAVKDYGKGTIVGATTYGKGTMQQLFALTDGSAVNLTIAKFFPPVSDNFDGVGVAPDIVAELSEDLQERFYFLTDDEDTQLKTAVSALMIGGAQTNTGSGTSGSNGSSAEESASAESGAEGAGTSSAAALEDDARQVLHL
ncbi:MAG: S41 family peptidase [Acutalibacteraceae bacterium]|jgi:carboxyl-terminal processing protease